MGAQTYSELIELLVDNKYITSENLKEAFLCVDRKYFIPKKHQDKAYDNTPIPIWHEQTISQPLTVAFMLEQLQVKKGMKVLDVGSGSGWTTAILQELVGQQGKVIGVERIPELVEFSQKNLQKVNSDASIIQATDALGYPSQAPYDRILVSAAATKIPSELVNQLADDGLLVIPVNNNILTVDTKGKIVNKHSGFRFVPLIT